ncbi:phosphotransferase [Serinicoccus kebangsaanensis]|uniref:phosphotransferase n=1 Tax=Serinicoccus kebangsaanensis TaxID=2602069 RepID=UPI00178C431E|nr:phosphotransferase [Serinicoccus kebangsaanensis]
MPDVTDATRELGVSLERALGGRSSTNWLVSRGGHALVLRQYLDVLELGPAMQREAIDWQVQTRARVHRAGWPVAAPVGQPLRSGGAWWTLEEWLPGTAAQVSPTQHANLLARWGELGDLAQEVGPQPHRFDHLAVLVEADAAQVLAECADEQDRGWLLRRLDQVLSGAQDVDWDASPRTLVHGDLVGHNLLWSSGRLTGVLDLELATVDRRITEAMLVWRSRHDDVLLAYDQVAALNDQEWRMVLIDWWALMLSLCLFHLRRGRQPGRWELDGLRRTSPLSEKLSRDLFNVTP